MSRELGICPSTHTASSIPLSRGVLIVCLSKSPPKVQWPGPRAESLACWEDLAAALVTDSAMSSPCVSSLSVQAPWPKLSHGGWSHRSRWHPGPRSAFALPKLPPSATCPARWLRSPAAPRAGGVVPLHREPSQSSSHRCGCHPTLPGANQSPSCPWRPAGSHLRLCSLRAGCRREEGGCALPAQTPVSAVAPHQE